MQLEAEEFERKRKEREALKQQMLDMKNKASQRKSVADELKEISSGSDDDDVPDLSTLLGSCSDSSLTGSERLLVFRPCRNFLLVSAVSSPASRRSEVAEDDEIEKEINRKYEEELRKLHEEEEKLKKKREGTCALYITELCTRGAKGLWLETEGGRRRIWKSHAKHEKQSCEA